MIGQLTIAVFGASRSKPGDPYYEEARLCGQLLAESGYRIATGGYAGAIAVGVVAKILFPEVFVGGYVKIIALGFMTATAAIVGDIIESVFKRSAGIKDSGHVIPGRGGVLDSVDSILLAAPVFYIICDFLYGMS